MCGLFCVRPSPAGRPPRAAGCPIDLRNLAIKENRARRGSLLVRMAEITGKGQTVQQFRGQDKSVHQRYSRRTGILLTNLGTPQAPTKEALKPYLAEFLSDMRVIELPRWKWWPILNGIILRTRPAKSAELYRSVWTEDGSPLMKISLQQRDGLQAKLAAQGIEKPVVKLAMRYGQPAIGEVLKEFQDEGINRIVVLPLYPQYSASTTGSTFDAVSKELTGWRWLPELHFLSDYYDHPLYIEALVNSIREQFATQGVPDKLVLSYHGMPQRYFDNGDPYYCFCQKTSRLVAEQLGLAKESYITSFQSLFGREEWLKPYTSATLTELAQQGVAKVAVVCPGFSADCLETIEEIAVENKQVFLEAGGKDYYYIPALNDRDDHLQLMWELVRVYLQQPQATAAIKAPQLAP